MVLIAQIHEENYYYDIVRKNIRYFRKQKGFTLQRLSEKALMSMDYLAEIESEKRKKSFSIAVLGRIADSLEIDITEFFKNKKN